MRGELVRVCVGVAALLPAGCAVGPDFKLPDTAQVERWEGAPPRDAAPSADVPSAEARRPRALPHAISAAEPAEISETHWWRLFSDPTLNALVEQALRSNLDLKQAVTRIRAARAAVVVAQSGLFPQLQASLDYNRSGGLAQVQSATPVTRAATAGVASGVRSIYRAGFDTNWEIDIFGGQRRGLEAAEADLQAAIEDRRAVLVALLGELADNYFALRGAQRQLAVARDNVATQMKSVELSRQRYEAGFVSYLDVANAEAQVATTRSQIPGFETAERTAVYALGVLLGEPPAERIASLSEPRPIPAVPPRVPVGLPSELLTRRPDIRQAGEQLHAAIARIGVAEADLYPSFSLTGAFGYASTTLDSLLRNGGREWSIIPGMTWPLFTAGRLRAQIEIAGSEAEGALYAYQQAFLVALKEVETALTAYANEQRRRLSLLEAVEANRNAVKLATELYVAGQTDFLNVINAKQQLYTSEDALAQSDRTVGTNLVALYKALGGGWEE